MKRAKKVLIPTMLLVLFNTTPKFSQFVKRSYARARARDLTSCIWCKNYFSRLDVL